MARANKKADAGGFAKVADVNKAFQQLSRNQESLGKLFNVNIQNITNAFDMVDGHQFVMRRILNDIVKGDVVLCDDPSSGVNYEWYFQQYNGVRAFSIAVQSLMEKPAEEPAPAASAETNEIIDEFEFGGNYADQAASAG